MQINAAMDWVGGVVPAKPNQASASAGSMAVWLQDGQVLGQCDAPALGLHSWDDPEGPGFVLVRLLLAIVEEKTGPAPLRLRIEVPELAQFLRQFTPPFITVVSALTPELNRWAESHGDRPGPMVPDALDFSELPPLERLAAELFELKPWFFIAPLSVFQLRVPALGLENAALTFLAERNGQASVYVVSERAELEVALRSGVVGAFDALPCYELFFERAAEVGVDERKALIEAGWWFPKDEPNLRPVARYQEGNLTFRPFTEHELEILQVGAFALQSMFGESARNVDVTRTAIVGSWTLKLSGDRTAHVELQWLADPVKGFPFFLPENNEHFIRHRDRILRRLGFAPRS